MLGYCYENGGVEKDPSNAEYWIHQAAQQNGSYASFALAYCYRVGLGVQEIKTGERTAKLSGGPASQVRSSLLYDWRLRRIVHIDFRSLDKR